MPYLLFKAHVLFSEISMVSWCERRISRGPAAELHRKRVGPDRRPAAAPLRQRPRIVPQQRHRRHGRLDRKSTRLNSSHSSISYAVFCLKKKNKIFTTTIIVTTK